MATTYGTGRALVTGANGYVGSNLIAALLARGTDVCALARGGAERVREAIDNACVAGARSDSWGGEMVELDLTVAGVGIDDTLATDIFRAPCDFWHVAANTSLSPNHAASLWETNLAGTERALDLFCAHAAPGSRFLHISTVYVCGIIDRVAPEDWFETAPLTSFRTVYEATKREAELAVRRRIAEDGISARVFRLGQIVGSSTTGATTSNAGIYGAIDAISRLSEMFPGERIRIRVAEDGAFNLVPIDTCVDWLLRLADALAPSPPIVHVSDVAGIDGRLLIRLANEERGINVVPVLPQDWDDESATQPERLVAARLEQSNKYLLEPIVFDRRNLLDALGPVEVPHDEPALRRILASVATGRETQALAS